MKASGPAGEGICSIATILELSVRLKEFKNRFGADKADYTGFLLGECYRFEHDDLAAIRSSLLAEISREETSPRNLYNTACAFALASDKSSMLWALDITIKYDSKFGQMGTSY